MKKLNISELKEYRAARYQLIPLFRFTKVDQDGKLRGKSPINKDWRKTPHEYADIIEHAKKGKNVGVRLKEDDLVLDVDPRNFPEGDNVLKRFKKDLQIDLNKYPHVLTPSGGHHYYMKKPKDIKITETLQDYPGIEFKGLGRQVVAAGSIHPGDGKKPEEHPAYGVHYKWDFLGPRLEDVIYAPSNLLKLIRRTTPPKSLGGGEYEPEEIGTMLEALDPTEFREHQQWLNMMMACHHASGGDARQEFIEWSTRDPNYSDQSWSIGRRWDSLHTAGNSSGQITFRTLHKELHDRKLSDAIPRTPAADDFASIGPDDFPDDENEEDTPACERRGPLEKMNDKYWAVDDNGKFKIYAHAVDPTYKPARRYWRKYGWHDFEKLLANRRVQKGDSTLPAADAWLNWGRRRQVEGVVFDPEHEHPGFLNLWTGWAVEPKQGKWDYLQELVHEVLCDNDDRSNEYVLNWAADMVQRPGQTAEVALAFQGLKGTGKGTFGRALSNLAGQHGLHITSPEHLTGRFNAHLRDVVCLFADEAVSPYDQAANSRLKGLITEPTIPIEGKGVDILRAKNLVHIVMASNEDWFIPMGLSDERRFFVSKVNTKRQGDKTFFKRLHDQLDTGGYAAMLYDLLHRDISSWRPRDDIPTTDAAIEQKVRSLNPIAQWWFNIVSEGEFPFMHAGNWHDIFPIRAFKNDVRVSFEDFCRKNNIKPGAMGRSNDMLLAKEIKALAGDTFRGDVKLLVPDDRPDVVPHSDGRQWAFEFPCLAACREEMEKHLGGKLRWNQLV